jgi:hypothetical protein
MTVDMPWYVLNVVIRRDHQTPTLNEEICRYSSQYSACFSAHPSNLVVNLLAQPDNNRRLLRHLPTDLLTRLLICRICLVHKSHSQKSQDALNLLVTATEHSSTCHCISCWIYWYILQIKWNYKKNYVPILTYILVTNQQHILHFLSLYFYTNFLSSIN